MVDGNSGGGLDPQVASSPLEPTVVTGHHLAFPQYWEQVAGGKKDVLQEMAEERREEGQKRSPLPVWQFLKMAAEGAYHNRTE